MLKTGSKLCPQRGNRTIIFIFWRSKFLIVWCCACASGTCWPGGSGLKIGEELLHHRELLDFICDILQVFGTSPRDSILFILSLLIPEELLMAYVHYDINVWGVINHSSELVRFRNIKPGTINERPSAANARKRNCMLSEDISVMGNNRT